MSWTNAHLFQWATWRQTLLKFQSNFIFFFHENAFENICKCHHFNSGLKVLMFVPNLENSISKKRTKLLILRFLAIKGPVFYTVQCRHNSVQYIMVLLHTTIQWQEQNINQIMKSEMTPHTSEKNFASCSVTDSKWTQVVPRLDKDNITQTFAFLKVEYDWIYCDVLRMKI